MNILETVLSAEDGGPVRQISQQFGLTEQQTASALSALLPALATGFQRNLQSEGGVASLASALGSGRHQRYLEDPSVLGDASTTIDGNGILSHILGSKEVSRQVASRAAQQTGISDGVLKQLLPIAAAMMMGTMSRQSRQANLSQGAPGGADLMSMLTPLLDRNQNGSLMDDVSGMLGRFLGPR
jgi:hypothetical protein